MVLAVPDLLSVAAVPVRFRLALFLLAVLFVLTVSAVPCLLRPPVLAP